MWNLVSKTVQSCDPNEISGPLGTGEGRYVLQGEWMNYTIYFENKTNATAAAQEITVTLPMDPGLDWSTLELGEIAFGEHIDMGLNGKRYGNTSYALPGTNTSVKTEVSTVGTNLVWYLRIYDPTTLDDFPDDPRGGFLPPNDPETHCGEGHLSYRVKVADATPNGTVIRASADIQFDTNEHIETDPSWWNTVYAGGEAEFDAEELKVDEGGTLKVVVSGGNMDEASSVQLAVQYNTAAAADLDLKGATVNGVKPSKTLAFPVTLSWAAGEIGEKTVEIPVKKDSAVENDEFLTLQLSKPSGLELGEARVCTVWIHDPGYDALKAKAEDGTLTTKEKKTWDALLKARLPYVRSLAEPAHMGKVSGYGKFAKGKKVTLKATASKGYAFAGWYLGGELVTKSASYSFKATGEDADYRARFVTLAEDKASIGATVNGMAFSSTSGQETASPLATNAMCGVALFWPLSHEALSATSVKVTGLPKGLKYDTKKKAITGVPTVPGKTSSVKVAVTTAGKQKATFVLKVTVDPLPEWARGQFTGTVDGNTLTMTVGTTGKVSGKFKDGITNWTFSASSFATNSVTVGETNLFCRATAKGTYKNAKKKTVTVTAPIAFSLWARPDLSPIAAEGLGDFAGGTDNVVIRRAAGVKLSVDGVKGGTVKMDKSYGQVASGKSVKFMATVTKGYAFLGWFDAQTGVRLSQATAYSLKMSGADRIVVARFAKESALAAANFTLAWNAPTNVCRGVSYSAKPSVSGIAAVKITSVSGLPKGLSYKSGKVTGVPTAVKTNTVSVTFALATNAKKKFTLKQKLVVAPLPAWATQTFEGDLGTEDAPVPVTVTVASSGNVSGKYGLDGATWTFSASSLSSAVYDETTHEPQSFAVNATASATINRKKKSQKLVVTVMEEGVDIQVP